MSDLEQPPPSDADDRVRPEVPGPPTIGGRAETGRPARVGPRPDVPETVPGPPEEEGGGDFEIALGPVQTVEYEQRTAPDNQRRLDCARYGREDDREPRIFMHMAAMAKIEAHGRTDLSKEIGGVMMGEYGTDEKGVFVEVLDAIPADHVEHSSAQIKFTHESWPDIYAKHEQQCPDLKYVGWYHTHPGFGVFLSHMDVFIHKHFFNTPGHIAYVYDPVNRRRAFFRWAGKKIQAAGGFMIFGKRKDARQLEQHMERLRTESAPPGQMAGSSELSSRVLDQVYALGKQVRYVLLGMGVLAGILLLSVFWSMMRLGKLTKAVGTANKRLLAVQQQSDPLKMADDLTAIGAFDEAVKYYRIAELYPGRRTVAVEKLVVLYERMGKDREARSLIRKHYNEASADFAEFYKDRLIGWLKAATRPARRQEVIALAPADLLESIVRQELSGKATEANVDSLRIVLENSWDVHKRIAFDELVRIGKDEFIDKLLAKSAGQIAEKYITDEMTIAADLDRDGKTRAALEKVKALLMLSPEDAQLKGLRDAYLTKLNPPAPDRRPEADRD